MNKTLNLLGLCRKAGKVCLGTDSVVEKLQNKKVSYIFLANDSTDQAIDKIIKKSYFYQVEVNKSFDSKELNQAIGTNNYKVIGILDNGFSKKFKELSKVESE